MAGLQGVYDFNMQAERIQRWLTLIVFVFVGFVGARAQADEKLVIPVQRDPSALVPIEAKLESKLMARSMPYRVLLPKNYESEKQRRYPVIYLLHGLMGSHRNWTDLTKLTTHARDFDFIIVTPEGNNGWYTDSATVPDDKYESYIIKELIPEVDAKYRTMAARDSRAIAGLSMGGYGAIKFGLKYPGQFRLAGSFSGALGAASIRDGSPGPNIGRSIENIFGPVGSESRASNDIFGIVRSLTAVDTKSLPFIYIDCGTEDFLFANNREFISLVVEKKVPHEFRQLPGAHNFTYWNTQVLEFMRVAERQLSK